MQRFVALAFLIRVFASSRASAQRETRDRVSSRHPGQAYATGAPQGLKV